MNMNFDISAFAQLSGVLNQKLQNYTFADILSALQSIQQLPIHPYEQAKLRLFGKDHQFQTLADIPVPETFDYRTCSQELSCIFDRTNAIGLSALSAVQEKIKSGEILDKVSLKQSGIEESMFDEEIAKQNIEFSEIVNSMTYTDINTKPVETAQKLLTHYISLLNR